MIFCPHYRSGIESSQNIFCSTCGKPIRNFPASINKNVSQKSSVKTKDKNRTIIVFGIVGFVFLILLTVLNKDLSQHPDGNLNTNYNTYSKQISNRSIDIVRTGFYFNIGLTAHELIEKLGQPTTINQTLYVYDNAGFRLMFGFKNNRVHNASYILVGIDPIDVPTTISALMTDLVKNNFRRIADFGNIIKYTKDKFEISIIPGKTEDGTYNIAIMAFRN